MLLTVLLDAGSARTASLHHYTILLLDDVMVTVWVSLVTQQLWVQFPVILLAGNNLRRVVHTHTHAGDLSPSSINWSGDAQWLRR